jgi:hypothetical protein
VKAELARHNRCNVDHRYVSLDNPESAHQRSEHNPLAAYVALVADCVDESLGFVVVDGHYLTTCITAIRPKIEPGGLLLEDVANMWPDNEPPVTGERPEVSRTTNEIKFTVIWRKQ